MASPAGNVVSSGLDAARMQKTLDLLDEQVKKTKYEAETQKHEEAVARQRRHYLTGEMAGQDSLLLQRLRNEVDLLRAQRQNQLSAARRAGAEADVLSPKARMFQTADEFLAPALEFIANEGGGALNRLLPGGP